MINYTGVKAAVQNNLRCTNCSKTPMIDLDANLAALVDKFKMSDNWYQKPEHEANNHKEDVIINDTTKQKLITTASKIMFILQISAALDSGLLIADLIYQYMNPTNSDMLVAGRYEENKSLLKNFDRRDEPVLEIGAEIAAQTVINGKPIVLFGNKNEIEFKWNFKVVKIGHCQDYFLSQIRVGIVKDENNFHVPTELDRWSGFEITNFELIWMDDVERVEDDGLHGNIWEDCEPANEKDKERELENLHQISFFANTRTYQLGFSINNGKKIFTTKRMIFSDEKKYNFRLNLPDGWILEYQGFEVALDWIMQ